MANKEQPRPRPQPKPPTPPRRPDHTKEGERGYKPPVPRPPSK